MRHVRVGIVADDLTSAMDGAGPFLRSGARAVVLLEAGTVQGQADVVSIDTDSRHRDPEQAAVRTAAAVRALGGADVLVKTVDSTLRGNVDSEVRAALRASGRPLAVVAPAFPAEGRTTVAGTQLVDGVPVHQTVFASDGRSPAALSDLRAIIPGARVMSAATGLAAQSGIWIADASADADLDALVTRAGDPRRVLWVGSPGLAAALGRAQRFGTGTPSPLPASRRVLVVVGSRHPASLAQARALAGQDTIDAGGPRAAALISRQLRSRNLAVITGPPQQTAPDEAAQLLAGLAADAARQERPGALIATGGATARAVLARLGIPRIEARCEPEPGVVIGRAAPGGLVVAVKAGGFGDDGTLVRLAARLAPSTSPSQEQQ